ncbi:MAG: putative permease of the major facilitator superfamily, partial [Phycisphaerales bacterium]|nr:putative permease of the major facilitator superfamily [Phycisphaerales bacterium]
AGFVSALCWCGGLFLGAIGVYTHQLWLLWLGSGVIGGIGLGLGYISPVSTLIKWFADRPGLATGMAIMGFGGGAMVAAPLSNLLMATFAHGTDPGVAPTFLVLGLIYGIFILFGAFLIRVPPKGWLPAGYTPPTQSHGMISSKSLDATTAIKTPQFWLLWIILCTNVTAGIGILEQASPMIQELFKGRLGSTTAAAAAAGGGFVGLLSLFNMVGRFGWSSLSDKIGRKATYFCFFLIGIAGYVYQPSTDKEHLNSLPLFVNTACDLLSKYGGGFATIPAYLRDMFGPANVSAIHGRLLTAWSVAGVLGPALVNYIRAYYTHDKVVDVRAYPTVLYLMAGLLCVGLVANVLVRPVADRFFPAKAGDAS